MDFLVGNFQVFLLILVRMLGMFVVAPVFSSGVIPFRIRAVFALYIAICIFPTISPAMGGIEENMYAYGLSVLTEAVIGYS